MEALELAQQYFSRYNLDLIYARPGQGLQDWEVELKEGDFSGCTAYVALSAYHCREDAFL